MLNKKTTPTGLNTSIGTLMPLVKKAELLIFIYLNQVFITLVSVRQLPIKYDQIKDPVMRVYVIKRAITSQTCVTGQLTPQSPQGARGLHWLPTTHVPARAATRTLCASPSAWSAGPRDSTGLATQSTSLITPLKLTSAANISS